MSIQLLNANTVQMDATPHLLLVAGPGLGHIAGLLLLAKALLSTGCSVCVAWFAKSYRAQQNRLPSFDPAIRFEVLDDGSSPDTENYRSLFTVTPKMQEGLAKLVERLTLEQVPVCCIVSDTSMPFTQDVADRFGIPRVEYWSASATAYAMISVLPELISKGYVPQKDSTSDWKSEKPIFIDFVPGYPEFPLEEFPKGLLTLDISDPLLQNVLAAIVVAKKAERTLIHSLYELETNAFDGLRDSQYHTYSIGPLLNYASDSANESSEQQDSVRWLDTHTEASVIYVSFGSNDLMSDEEVLEMAFGLEASDSPFLWVIRSDQFKGTNVSDSLPDGFESRTKGRGKIVSWAPQMAVLAHPSVVGFLTHCGWNSLLESMWMGVPMLGCPRRADQRVNSRFMREKWGVGIEIGRTKEGSFGRMEVERGVKALMIGKEGQQARSKAREMRECVRKAPALGGDSHTNLNQFANDMRTLVLNTHKRPTLS